MISCYKNIHYLSYLLAEKLKREFDTRFGAPWHVIVGEAYSFNIDYDFNFLYYFLYGPIAILVWRVSRNVFLRNQTLLTNSEFRKHGNWVNHSNVKIIIKRAKKRRQSLFRKFTKISFSVQIHNRIFITTLAKYFNNVQIRSKFCKFILVSLLFNSSISKRPNIDNFTNFLKPEMTVTNTGITISYSRLLFAI